MSGKSDVIDAEHAARQVLASIDMPVPKSADGHVEAIRLIKIARDSAVKARSTTMITLKATLVTADVELRAETEVHRSRVSRGEVCSAVRKDQSCRGHIRPSSAAANALFEYLEIFHNPRRRHSSLGMLTPTEYGLQLTAGPSDTRAAMPPRAADPCRQARAPP